MKKKIVLLIISIILFLSLIGIGTYTWFAWHSTSTDTISVNLIGSVITYYGGPDINESLSPVSNYYDGIIKVFKVTTNASNNVFDLHLKINSIASELKDTSFKWVIYDDNDTYVEGGNFSTYNTGDDIVLLENRAISLGTGDIYKVYFYIDGNEENNPNMIGKSIDMTLYAIGSSIGSSSVDINEPVYLMAKKTNTGNASSFWGTSINVSEVKSITITTKDHKPSTVAGEADISYNTNSGDVIMWWIQNGSLYDVYIASKSGIVRAPTSISYMFAYLPICDSINLSGFDTRNTTDFSELFRNDSNLISFDGHGLNTSSLQNMHHMFYGCQNITSINLSGIDTSNVTDMTGMFVNCYKLESLDLSNLNTDSLTNTNGMFSDCHKLQTINLSSFDTSSVTNMNGMFFGCAALTNVIFSSNFKTNNVENMERMFAYCTSLVSLDLSTFTFESLTNSTKMFNHDSKLTNIDLRNAELGNITNFSSMFGSVPTSATIYLKDTATNRSFMQTNFSSYSPTYI